MHKCLPISPIPIKIPLTSFPLTAIRAGCGSFISLRVQSRGRSPIIKTCFVKLDDDQDCITLSSFKLLITLEAKEKHWEGKKKRKKKLWRWGEGADSDLKMFQQSHKIIFCTRNVTVSESCLSCCRMTAGIGIISPDQRGQ